MPEHIKFPDIIPVIRYAANGDQTIYDFPFPVFASEDLAVYFDGARQFSGFSVTGSGLTDGGSVIFDTPPPSGVIVRLERRMPLERMTDFLEGGDFSAASINTELDYLTAAIQQVARDQQSMLRYDPSENPVTHVLPEISKRAGQVLGFDENGNPIAVSSEGTMAAPDYTASGTGAVIRTIPDKLNETVSVKDFGAVGDGLNDDTLAIQQALEAHDHVLIPTGTYLISSPIRIFSSKALTGLGQKSVIICQARDFAAIEITEDLAQISSLQIQNPDIGIRLFGGGKACWKNIIKNVEIQDPNTGIQFDGYIDTAKPCTGNRLSNISILRPTQNGVHFTVSGSGSRPSNNKLYKVSVHSQATPISGSGFYIEHGEDNNTLQDCTADIDGSAIACFRLGSESDQTVIINPYANSFNLVPNVRLENTSENTAIYNLLALSDGAAIEDLSSGAYTAFNAGFPERNKMHRTVVSDLKATLMRYDTEFIDTPGLTNVDLSHTQHIVNATNGEIEMRLPHASNAIGVCVTIKKMDNTSNIVSITEEAGLGPDKRQLDLGGFNDYATVLSNGAEWFIIASNRMAGNTRFFDGSGLYDIDMSVDVYLLSSFSGALEARLPPANAPEAIGRQVTIKKTDPSTNTVTVTEQGGSGPDNFDQPLNNRYEAITVISDGAQWFIISKFV